MIWGFAEDYASIWTGQAIQQVNESLMAEANIVITVCITAGDDGSSDGISDIMHILIFLPLAHMS